MWKWFYIKWSIARVDLLRQGLQKSCTVLYWFLWYMY